MDSPNVEGRAEPRAGGSEPQGAARHPGARLRERREMRKLSLESVALQLHTSVQMVRALEENDLANLPPPVYVRGFLRSYARLVGLPESEVIGIGPVPPATARSLAGSATEPPLDFDDRRWPGLALTGMLALGAVAATALIAWQLWNGRLAAERRAAVESPAPAPVPAQPEVPATAPPPAEIPAAPAPVAAAPEFSSPEPAPPVAPAIQSPPSPASVSEPAPPPAAVQAAPAGAASVSANTLVLRFSGESWATVVDAAGKRLLYEAGLPGTSKTVSGQPPFKVTLGRPGHVSLEFNGQPFPHPYTDKSGPTRLKIGD